MSQSSLAPTRAAGNSRPRHSLWVDPPCIDLAERFGHRYRIEYEESYFAQYGPHARVNDPWLKTIPCRLGHLMPWGGSMLAAVTHRAGPAARKLAALPGAIVSQDGSDGAAVLFDVAILSEVAKLMHPKRRRKPPTEAQLAALAKGRRPFGQFPVDMRGPEGRPRVPTTLSD